MQSQVKKSSIYISKKIIKQNLRSEIRNYLTEFLWENYLGIRLCFARTTEYLINQKSNSYFRPPPYCQEVLKYWRVLWCFYKEQQSIVNFRTLKINQSALWQIKSLMSCHFLAKWWP